MASCLGLLESSSLGVFEVMAHKLKDAKTRRLKEMHLLMRNRERLRRLRQLRDYF